ncbi:hypothetical protein P7H17_26495 [Paenibacillus larvae]|nr:hypothetical protein [Paenibacillus larvae]
MVLPWPKKGSEEEKELIKQGFKKFVSNPNESHTAGDPYSDLEKASGAFDRTTTKSSPGPSCCGISQYYSWHGRTGSFK